MAEDRRLRAVVALAQAMAAAQTPRDFWRAAAEGARTALLGSFAALSVWERELGRLRVLVNAGQRAPDEEEFPESETYPVNRFPEITEFLHERWAGGGEPEAWVETADLPPEPPGSPASPASSDAGVPGAEAVSRTPVGSGSGPPAEPGLRAPDAPAAGVRHRGAGPLEAEAGHGVAEVAGAGSSEAGRPPGAGRTGPAAGAPGAGQRPSAGTPWEEAGRGSVVPEYGPHTTAPRGYRHPSVPPVPGGAEGRAAALRRRQRGCCVVAPIVLHGRAWGELYVARPLGAPVFDRDEADFATVLASVVAAGIAQTERLEEVRRLAFTDPLTGLANRRAVDIRLDEALERHREDGVVVSLVVCDLNGLKRVNDTHGHAVGDRLLERFGSVLSLCGAMLSDALSARLGGDEFCLLCVGPSSDEVVRVAGEVCVRAAELELGEGVACGVASTGDPIGRIGSARRLFRLADAAQYRAKAARSPEPVVAGRDGTVLRLADTPPRPQPQERRRFRGVSPQDAEEPWSEP
ncbi:diguanylate cyclase domain-containing protein [Streptomyces sp. NPDC051018]|uniref:diguanylate cyclase domain-containing protein n=1 Tax=Streptomyces sp. NPDC051018 TaxID=3365639 RepID=UPI0037A5BA27